MAREFLAGHLGECRAQCGHPAGAWDQIDLPCDTRVAHAAGAGCIRPYWPCCHGRSDLVRSPHEPARNGVRAERRGLARQLLRHSRMDRRCLVLAAVIWWPSLVSAMPPDSSAAPVMTSSPACLGTEPCWPMA